MELENITIASELTSSDPAKQINSLLILLRLYSAGKDVQHYVSTVIQSVLVKSTDTLVKKLCYQLIKGCSITSKYDWEFVMKAIVQDMANSTNNELSIWAMRTLVSLCGIGQKLQEFFFKNTRQFEECVFRKDSERVRVSALNVLRVLIKSLRKTALMNANTSSRTSSIDSSVNIFGPWVLRSIKDSNQEVACAGFEVLREVICGDCVCHFHEESLPLLVSKESIEWMRFMAKEYSYLLSRIKCMDVRRRYPALRPVTYIALFLNQEMNTSEYGATNLANVIKPMLHSVEVATVLESCHCILLIASDRKSTSEITACVNYNIDDAVTAYLSLLERNETSMLYASIMKDVCAVLNSTRAKYNNCSRMIENISKISNDVDRIYILNTIYNTIIKCSVNTIMRRGYVDIALTSEMEKLGKENFVNYCWHNASTPFEQKLRCEMLFSACQQFMSLQPQVQNPDLHRAWMEVGIELCEQGKSCLIWNDCSGLNACVGEFGRVLTKMCGETFSKDMADSEERKRVQRILNQILDSILNIQTEFSEMIAMCILSNFVHLHKQVSGKESGDVVFDHVRFMLTSSLKQGGEIESIKLDTLLYCLLCVCMRSTLKLGDAYEYLKTIISTRQQKDETADRIYSVYTKIGYSLNYSVVNNPNDPDLKLLFGKQFHVDHPIFKAYSSEDDDKLVENYIKALQISAQVISNLHDEDPFNLKTVMMNVTVNEAKIQQRSIGNRDTRSTSLIVSHGSDPVAVTATYMLVPDTYTVYFHVRVANIASVDMFQVSVDVGTTGGLELFEKVPQSSQLIGELNVNGVYEFEREYIVERFDQSAFHIIVHASHTRGSTGDMMDMFAEAGPQNATVAIRCRPLEISIDHMLNIPKPVTNKDFLSLWEISHSGFHQKISVDQKLLKNIEQETLNEKLDELMHSSTAATDIQNRVPPRWISTPSPSHQPQIHHSYVTHTLFDDYILVTFFGIPRQNSISYDLEFRCANAHVIDVLRKNSRWLSNMVNRCEGVRFLREGEKERINDVMGDGGMDLRLNVSQMFGLNDTKLSVLHLQKWHSISDARVINSDQ